jgi:hypothetical protein
MDSSRTRKKRFQALFRLLLWWKRNRFQYLTQADTHEEPLKQESTAEAVNERHDLEEPRSKPSTPTESLGTPLSVYFNEPSSNQQKSYPFGRTPTVESFQDALEDMDSVIDSHWDFNDETSQITERVNNVHGDVFLLEHLVCAS